MSIKTIAVVAALLLLGLGFNLYQHHQLPPNTLQPLDIPTHSTPAITPETVTVYITGAVHHPGLYHIPKDTRIVDALKIAGGKTPQANLEKVNLASKIKDGQRIFVPEKKAPKTPARTTEVQTITPVNLNHASTESLSKIPKLSAKTAADIVAFREKNGPFTHIDDLTKVKGIGLKTLEKWRAYITL
jgi:competence protein ComEA